MAWAIMHGFSLHTVVLGPERDLAPPLGCLPCACPWLALCFCACPLLAPTRAGAGIFGTAAPPVMCHVSVYYCSHPSV